VDYEREETTPVSRFSAPKGQKDSAQGFNPGCYVKGGCPESGTRSGDREVQFGQCAILQYSKTPSLHSPGFEDDDEDEYEAPHEWHQIWRLPVELV